MWDGKRLLAAAAIATGLVAGSPTSDAAWWNVGRDKPSVADEVTVAQLDEADRLNRIEAQMRSLTGQIEELSFQLRQLQDQLRRLQEDADFRFSTLEGESAPNPAQPPRQVGPGLPPATAPTGTTGVIANTPPPAPGPAPGPVLGAPPQPLGTLVITPQAPPAADQPLDLSTLARGGATAGPLSQAPTDVASPPAAPAPVEGQQVAVAEMTGDPTTDFSRSYNLVISGKYDLAESSFRQFLEAYPDSQFAPDAQYWLGESLFDRARYRDAADAFRAGYKAYPDSSRAPATLLRLGQSLAGLAERDAACQIYAQVLKQYPDMSSALRQRVVTEQASARC